MNVWAWLRVVAVAISFIVACFQPPSLGEPSGGTMHWDIGAVFFFAPIVGLLFILGIQFVNPLSAPSWEYPRWTLNPFTMKQPLQFFHLAAFVFLASGLGAVVNAFVTGASVFDAIPFVLLAMGLIAGVHICTIVYRHKMQHDA